VETDAAWIKTGQGATLEDAVEEAVEEMTGFLQARFSLDRTDAFLLVSAIGDVRIGQCARIDGCDMTVYLVVPKSLERF
jgi:acetamidase/formamidase